MDMMLHNFTEELAGKAAVPGGGSVAALAGSLGAALASMAANLTSGKKKYAAYQADIDRLLPAAQALRQDFLALMDKDAEAFLPLSKAYGIPKEDPNRDAVMEEALRAASAAPVEVLEKALVLTALLEELVEKCSALVISDVGVAASCCKCAAESALLNVRINTKMMKDRAAADAMDARAEAAYAAVTERCGKLYNQVLQGLR
ncbi:MAG: cyclodeaminase/cyclohydrolase family protein [Clostridia bacterium]|nr:cyclodeaminase/cyclohydrolase family protein [Clostridia bacterium]